MSNYFTKITSVVALTCLMAMGVDAQQIDMGTDKITFGAGCNKTYIVDNGNLKMAFGYNQGCIGPPYTLSTIFFEMDPARIGIGMAPAYQLQLATNSAAKPGSTAWTVPSDARYKQDVRPYTDGLELVRSINPIYFHYNEVSGFDTKPEYVGLLAQELQQVAPYMVNETERKDASGAKQSYLDVDFGAMDFALINAVKELDTQLQAAQAENVALREEMDAVRAEIAAMKSQLAGKPVQAVGMTLAPNPVDATAAIQYNLPDGSRNAAIQVFGIDGKQATEQTSLGTSKQGSISLNVAALPQGTYIVKLVADGKTVSSQRMVVAH